MTKKENIDWLYRLKSIIKICMPTNWVKPLDKSLDVAIKSLKRESSCEKCPTKYELEVNLKKWADAYRRGLEDGRREANNTQATERIEYGTDGNTYKMSISNGHEFEK